MTQTALDEIVSQMQLTELHDGFYQRGDNTEKAAFLDYDMRFYKDQEPYLFSQALQDPRYLAFCKEQDRKEEGQAKMYCPACNGTGRDMPVGSDYGRSEECLDCEGHGWLYKNEPLDLRAENRRLAGQAPRKDRGPASVVSGCWPR